LNQTVYRLKQAALALWKELLQAFKKIGFRRSASDLCLYIKNTSNGLVIWISWVDDCLLLDHQEDVSKNNKIMNSYFEWNNIDELKEYIRCKIKNREGDNRIMIVQPVIIRSL
jgi:hypothetical protein